MDGLYAAFLTGMAGNGVVFLVLQNGVVTGADFTGVTLDGTYVPNEGGKSVTLKLISRSPPGITTIQGAVISAQGQTNEMAFVAPLGEDTPFFSIDTPNGPVNVRLQKLRSFVERG